MKGVLSPAKHLNNSIIKESYLMKEVEFIFATNGHNLRSTSPSCHIHNEKRKQHTTQGMIKNEYSQFAGRKNDLRGIRTLAQKTAALTQRLRPLGHKINAEATLNKYYTLHVKKFLDDSMLVDPTRIYWKVWRVVLV